MEIQEQENMEIKPKINRQTWRLARAEFLPVQDDDLDKAILCASTAYESLIRKACEGKCILKKNYKAWYKAKMEESRKQFRLIVCGGEWTLAFGFRD